MSISWDAPITTQQVLTYRVRYRSILETSFTSSGNISGTSLTVPNVPAGTYYFVVDAITALGTGSSPVQLVSTASGPPAAPVLSTPIITGRNVEFRWTAVEGATYQIRAGLNPGQSDFVEALSGTSSTLNIPAMFGDGPFYARVRAVAGGQESADSNEQEFRFGAPTTPTLTPTTSGTAPGTVSAPANLQVTETATDLRMEWDWTGDASSVSFKGTLRQGDVVLVENFGLTGVTSLGGGRFRYIGNSQTLGTFTVTIVATVAGRDSAPSAPVTYTVTGSPTTTPAPTPSASGGGVVPAPSNVSVTFSGGNVTVRWDWSGDPTNATFDASLTGAQTGGFPLNYTRTGTSYVYSAVNQLRDGGTYQLTITAKVGGRSSAPSAPVTFTSGESESVPAPTNVQVASTGRQGGTALWGLVATWDWTGNTTQVSFKGVLYREGRLVVASQIVGEELGAGRYRYAFERPADGTYTLAIVATVGGRDSAQSAQSAPFTPGTQSTPPTTPTPSPTAPQVPQAPQAPTDVVASVQELEGRSLELLVTFEAQPNLTAANFELEVRLASNNTLAASAVQFTFLASRGFTYSGTVVTNLRRVSATGRYFVRLRAVSGNLRSAYVSSPAFTV